MITISLKNLFFVICLAFVFVLLTSIVFKITDGEIIMAIVAIYYFGFIILFLRKNKLSFYEFFQFNDFNFKEFTKNLFIYIGKYLLLLVSLALIIFLFLIVIRFFYYEKFLEIYAEFEKLNTANFFDSVRYPILKIINLLLLVPVFEEIIYRRFLFYSLRKKHSFFKASVISSIIFTLFHVDKLIMVFIGSMFLSYVFEKEKNIILNILIHSFVNLLFLVSCFF